jgi:predicted Zn-dependent protease
LKEFDAEIRLQPFSASAHVSAGQVLMMLGRDEEAGKMLNAAARMDRPPSAIYLLLGKLDIRRRDYRNAVTRLIHYTSLDQGNSTAYFQLAMAYRALGEKDKMNRALARYKKTSIDAKQRSNAQRELRPLEQQGEITDEAEARTSTVQ